MHKILDDNTVLKYADIMAQKLGVKIPDLKHIKKRMLLTVPQQTVVDNGEYKLWIDKFYIAYSRHDEDDIHYVYITKQHIYEEYDSFKKAREYRKTKLYLPKRIRQIFNSALCRMRASGLDYCVDKIFFEIG